MTIMDMAMLNVSAGVTMVLSKDVSLVVRGTLVMRGLNDSYIFIKRAGVTNDYWGSISFVSMSIPSLWNDNYTYVNGTFFENVDISGGGDLSTPVINSNGISSLMLKNVNIGLAANSLIGITQQSTSATSLLLLGCSIHDNMFDAITMNEIAPSSLSARISIINSTFTNITNANQQSSSLSCIKTICLGSTSNLNQVLDVYGTTFTDNDVGIYSDSCSSTDLENSLFRYNKYGIRLLHNNAATAGLVMILNNIFDSNGYISTGNVWEMFHIHTPQKGSSISGNSFTNNSYLYGGVSYHTYRNGDLYEFNWNSCQ